MEVLEELLQQASEDGRPTIVDIIKDVIAALPTGEMTDVLVKAHLVDPDLANVLTGICLEMLAEQAIANEGILSIQ
jgi:hypothetical protein